MCVFEKKEYTAPKLDTSLVEMEQGIAAGSASASLKAPDKNEVVLQEEWDIDPNDKRTVEW
ncbi:hypothetical protein GNY06_04630 [Elizabethkingia argentiflava]|uniref:Uncharacterized protein n=1 Tax=Elizabethkingia argenteiflava TaxID=2681556 RepID=A0A845PX84_9FLAO|nr:hypothetical protein [Elizabethkingia argenteiflava]NAW50700.1 hypothetical protein [Elizabethkingia argenteiflava]